MRVLIVDDEPLARRRIRRLLVAERDLEIAGECGDGAKALAAIAELRPDLLFLDVQMPGQDGFAVLAAAPRPWPLVIFCTAYDEYAVRAFEVQALDYLLKPFTPRRFAEVVQRARTQWARGGEVEARLAALLAQHAPAPRRIAVKSKGRTLLLDPADIHYVRAEGNYARIVTANGSHLVRDTMNSLERDLGAPRFVRIHRSVIVQLDRVRELQPWFRGDYVAVLDSGVRLPLSRTFRESVLQRLARRK